MRIRSIKPEFWKDELVSKWPVITRLTYIGLWSEADDYGRIRWLPEYLRAAIFPYDTRMNMAAALKPIEESGRVFVYESQGNRYAVILTWPKHQNINRKSRPQLPDPPREELAKFIEDSLKTQCGLTECSVSTREYFNEDSVSTQRPSRARASQGAGSREQGAGSREGAEGDEAHGILGTCRYLAGISWEKDLLARQSAGIDLHDPGLVELARSVVDGKSMQLRTEPLREPAMWWAAVIQGWARERAAGEKKKGGGCAVSDELQSLIDKKWGGNV
jgi:hypothetical protein